MRPLLLSVLLPIAVPAVAQDTLVELPAMNRAVLAFVQAHMGKKVGTGECWDLAALALDKVGAAWDHDLRFGREVDPKREAVLPGDIMQFEGVEVNYTRGTDRVRESYGHHTAIVWAVKSPGVFTLAHQNIGRGRFVQLSDLAVADVTKGVYRFYRPVR